MGRKYLTPVFVALLAPWVLFLVWVPPAYLHRAVAAGDVKTLRRLLALPSTDVNAINRDGRTPLLEASRAGSLDAIKSLLAHPRVNVNAGDRRGRTALHEAASLGRDVFASILLKHPRIQVDVMDKLGHTPLQAAALNSRAHLVRLLIKDGRADSSLALPGPCPGRTLLHAVSDAQVLRDLLGAQRSDPRAVDCVGDSPLHAAIRRGGSEGVRATATLLADARVDINYANKAGETPLHVAALLGRTSIVVLILDNPHVDIVRVTERGDTALDIAREAAALVNATSVQSKNATAARNEAVDKNMSSSPGDRPGGAVPVRPGSAVIKLLEGRFASDGRSE